MPQAPFRAGIQTEGIRPGLHARKKPKPRRTKNTVERPVLDDHVEPDGILF
ncbi:MAG: hypothetical protein ACRDRY_24420 [Pseudonocardiaceae bacterium]